MLHKAFGCELHGGDDEADEAQCEFEGECTCCVPDDTAQVRKTPSWPRSWATFSLL